MSDAVPLCTVRGCSCSGCGEGEPRSADPLDSSFPGLQAAADSPASGKCGDDPPASQPSARSFASQAHARLCFEPLFRTASGQHSVGAAVCVRFAAQVFVFQVCCCTQFTLTIQLKYSSATRPWALLTGYGTSSSHARADSFITCSSCLLGVKKNRKRT